MPDEGLHGSEALRAHGVDVAGAFAARLDEPSALEDLEVLRDGLLGDVHPLGDLHHRHDITARCRPERVWALLANLEAVATYNQTISAARVRGAARSGVGAERECDLKPNGRVVERVIVWEEGRAVGLEVVESDWPRKLTSTLDEVFGNLVKAAEASA